MNCYWNKQGSSRLILFFSGWGMDELPTSHLDVGASDLCVCYDYASPALPPVAAWRMYDEIELFAWSWGVMMAEKLAGSLALPILRAVAINGTPRAVHDRYGIPLRIATLTLQCMDDGARSQFQQRMCSSSDRLIFFESRKPKRSTASCVEELRFLIEQREVETHLLPWSRAYISLNDRIIAPTNQVDYWSQSSHESIDLRHLDSSHYPFADFTAWAQI